ncbi:MAG: glycosyltransferase, partial [Deltaproteobacteria bacterium]|nr:glycosyltransferase [Candidatus Desulfacyla euxinica]
MDNQQSTINNQQSTVSIVIPVFNEEENLEELLERCLNTCMKMEREFEIILIDDGSSDESRNMITKAAEQNPGKIVGL